MAQQTKYAHGKNPNSLANLKKSEGRPTQYGTEKKRRNVSVTCEGWEGIGELAQKYGCSNKSEFLEKLGRGIIKLQVPA